MKKLLPLIALVGIVIALPALAATYATNTLTFQGDITSGDSIHITLNGNPYTFCFSDTGGQECDLGSYGAVVGMDHSPHEADNTVINALVQVINNVGNPDNVVTASPLEAAVTVTANAPGNPVPAITTTASCADGCSWQYGSLYWATGSLDPVQVGNITRTSVTEPVNDILHVGILPVLLIVAGLIGLGYLVHFVYDQVGPSVGGSPIRGDALAENRRIMQEIHDKWPGHDDHSSFPNTWKP